jgi:hypothetical protein
MGYGKGKITVIAAQYCHTVYLQTRRFRFKHGGSNPRLAKIHAGRSGVASIPKEPKARP